MVLNVLEQSEDWITARRQTSQPQLNIASVRLVAGVECLPCGSFLFFFFFNNSFES